MSGRPPGRPPRADTQRVRELMATFGLSYGAAYLRWRQEQCAAGERPLHGQRPEVQAYLERHPGQLTVLEAQKLVEADFIRLRLQQPDVATPKPEDPLIEARKRLRAARLTGDLALIEQAGEELRLAQEAQGSTSEVEASS